MIVGCRMSSSRKILSLICLLGALALATCQDTDSCEPPLWHGEMGENWPLAGVHTGKRMSKSKPLFQLLVKGLGDGSTYTPGKHYPVIVKVLQPGKNKKRMHGVMVTADGEVGGCGGGTFKAKSKKGGTPIIKPGCRDVIIDGTTDLRVTKGVKWVAPTCGCVTIHVQIKSSDNMIYEEALDDETDAKYKRLVTRVCPPTPAT